MREGQKGFTWMLVIFILAWISFVQGTAGTRTDEQNISDGKKLFLDANVALSEKRFGNAYAIAEKLIGDHADDPQIWLYLHLYVHTFYFLDEDFQKGMLRPTPPGIQARIEALKAKSDKTVLDLVTLAWVVDAEKGFSIEHLEEIIKKFPDSAWADWAQTELAFEKIPGKGTTTKERAAEFYKFGVAFMKTHPQTHLMPRLLCITGNSRRRMSRDRAAKDEAVRMYQKVLDDYPSAEYYCASARRNLRELLGDAYKEAEGCSEERDRTTTWFYLHSPDVAEYKKHKAQYLEMLREEETKLEKKVVGVAFYPVLYVLGLVGVLGVIAVLILLHKRKTTL